MSDWSKAMDSELTFKPYPTAVSQCQDFEYFKPTKGPTGSAAPRDDARRYVRIDCVQFDDLIRDLSLTTATLDKACHAIGIGIDWRVLEPANKELQRIVYALRKVAQSLNPKALEALGEYYPVVDLPEDEQIG